MCYFVPELLEFILHQRDRLLGDGQSFCQIISSQALGLGQGWSPHPFQDNAEK